MEERGTGRWAGSRARVLWCPQLRLLLSCVSVSDWSGRTEGLVAADQGSRTAAPPLLQCQGGFLLLPCWVPACSNISLNPLV